MKTKRRIVDALIYVLLSILSLIWISPIVWLVLQSLSGDLGATARSKLVPDSFSFKNYVYLLTNKVERFSPTVNDYVVEDSIFNYRSWIGNTLMIAAITALISTILVLSVSFAFSRLRFKGRQGMMKVILSLGMFPGFLSMILLYQLFKLFNPDQTLTGSLVSLIVCYAGGAGMGYYISKGFFDTISKSIDEAAMLDGATRLQIFFKITIPLAKPIIVYTVLTSFMGPWADYILSSYILHGTEVTAQGGWTVAIGLFQMLDQTRANDYFNQFCAGSVIIGIPITALFIVMQRFYVGGVTGGAVKG
ncbi:MAG: sugar ABC transporter permease [Erysipelotrichaceae bacterium]|jgi:arabinogalactan oligomer/maltooligosaccharide transport system permease protein|nr:sugar ABC transporter permease [Erysipelotrichaceae bacterium]